MLLFREDVLFCKVLAILLLLPPIHTRRAGTKALVRGTRRPALPAAPNYSEAVLLKATCGLGAAV
jgi:hypothetical protein